MLGRCDIAQIIGSGSGAPKPLQSPPGEGRPPMALLTGLGEKANDLSPTENNKTKTLTKK